MRPRIWDNGASTLTRAVRKSEDVNSSQGSQGEDGKSTGFDASIHDVKGTKHFDRNTGGADAGAGLWNVTP